MLIATLKRGETALYKSVRIIIIDIFMNSLIGKKTVLIRCHNSYCDILSQPKKTIAYRKNQKNDLHQFLREGGLRLTSQILGLPNKGVETNSVKFSTTGVQA